jgi:hypothetical protein
MSDPVPGGMMRTRGGVRIAAVPVGGPGLFLNVQGIATRLTVDESHALRDLLHDAELRAARGDVIT